MASSTSEFLFASEAGAESEQACLDHTCMSIRLARSPLAATFEIQVGPMWSHFGRPMLSHITPAYPQPTSASNTRTLSPKIRPQTKGPKTFRDGGKKQRAEITRLSPTRAVVILVENEQIQTCFQPILQGST